MSSISINQIKYVLALDRTGSFSEAADSCFVTQSTLSTMVKKLEESLDIKLFDRKSKPIKLTEEGQKLIDQFKVVFNESENLLELVQETKEEFNGSLNIGIIPTLAPFLLPLFLDKIVKKFPKIEFSIFEITTNEIVSRLKLREIDIGLLSLPIKDKEIHSLPLFQEEFMVYDTSTKARGKKKYAVNDIDLSRLWLLEESHCLTNQIENICNLRNKNKSENNLHFKSGSLLTLLKLIHKNKGITLLPKLATLQSKLINVKYVHPLQSPTPVREIGFAMHSNFNKKRILNVLKEKILQSVEHKLGDAKKSQIIEPFS